MDFQKEKVKLISIRNPHTQICENYALSVNIIGQGKYAKVYKAVHLENIQQVYAVKVIQLKSKEVRQECLKELKIISHLPNSPHLVFIHKQHLENKNHLYIFQQFCEGGSLRDYKLTRKTPFSQAQVYDLFYQICKGYIDLHKAGILHEDIKPNNILLKYKNGYIDGVGNQYNVYKLCDFGVSQLASEFEFTNVRKGTISYMPPQKLKKKQFIPNARSDIYSLGVTLYEVIFGHHPYLDTRFTDYKTYLKIISIAQLKPLNEILSKDQYERMSIGFEKLYRIIEKMLQLNQSKRLSLEQLQQYIGQSDPFKNMSSQNYQSIAFKEKIKNNLKNPLKKQNIDIIATSFIQPTIQQIDKFSEILTPLRISKQLIELHFAFLKRAISYFTKGVQILKNSNQYQVIQKYYQPCTSSCKCHINTKSSKIKRIHFLQISFHYLNLHLMESFVQKCKQTVGFEKISQSYFHSIQDEYRYLNNQFLKSLASTTIIKKKQIHQQMEIKKNQLILILRQQIITLFNQIFSIKINFSQDILSFIFIKKSQQILNFLQALQCQALSNSCMFLSNQSKKSQKIIKEFENLCVKRKNELWKVLDHEIKNTHPIILDEQENSNQWEIINFQIQLEQNRFSVQQIQL